MSASSQTLTVDDGVVKSHSPQAPGDLLASAPAATVAAVCTAAQRGTQAQREWWTAGAGARGAALKALASRLEQRAEEAVDLAVHEVGKPVDEARAEVNRTISILDYYAQQSFAPLGSVFPASTAGMLWSERRPLGVAGIVTPWNFPFAIPGWKAAPALAAGNAVLLKPSPDALACASWLAEITEGVLPDHLLQVLPGGAETGEAVVAAADVVSFTGSETVGQRVVAVAAARGVPVQAEMGGQNAAVILPDADAAATAAVVAGASMGFAGQKCTATRRIVVIGSEARQQEVREALVAAVQDLRVGDPRQSGVALGPVITKTARERMLDAAGAVRACGGRLLTGGTSLDREGWFVAPTLADGVDHGHALAQEELFGPFALVLPAADMAEAVMIAEAVRFGLVTSVHGRDAGQLLDVAARVGTGMVKINAPTTGVDFYAPFGGERGSSYGPREQGSVALDFYSSVRTVTFAPHP